MAAINKILVFSAAVRGFHVYREVWNPSESEELTCLYERNNLFDMFAIRTCRTEDGITVGHLPREISRPTKFLIDRGAKVVAKLSATHYRRSPLFQGGLEIPCEVTVIMPGSIKGHILIQRYQQMVDELYCQPKEEVIMGCFLKMNELHNNEPPKAKKKKVSKKTEKPNMSKDIRYFFQNNERNNEDACKDAAVTPATIVID